MVLSVISLANPLPVSHLKKNKLIYSFVRGVQETRNATDKNKMVNNYIFLVGIEHLYVIDGAMTLSIMTFSIMTLSIMSLSIMTLSIMTLSIMTLSIMTLSIITLSIITFSIMTISMTLRIIDLIVTLSINDSQHK